MGYVFDPLLFSGFVPQVDPAAVPVVPTVPSLPATASDGSLAVVESNGNLYEYRTSVPGWVVIAGPGVILGVGPIDSVSPSADGAVDSNNELIMQSASATVPGLVNNTTQTFSGNKTLQGNLDMDGNNITNVTPVPNGVATLDSTGHIPLSQLPASVVEYKGTWAASTNTPTLTNADPSNVSGYFYIVSDNGTVDFGAGPIQFFAGDWVLFNGTIWERADNFTGYANAFLSNLAANTAVNSSLVPGTTDSINLGSATSEYLNVYTTVVKNTFNGNTIDMINGMLNDNSNEESLDWQGRLLTDTAGNGSVEWNTRQLDDINANPALNWNNRQLLDSANIESQDWDARMLNDNTGTPMVNYSVPGTFSVNATTDQNSHPIINVTDPTNPQDAATKNYVDTSIVHSSGVAGAVQFSDGAGGFSSDDASLHWNDATKNLTISPTTNGTVLNVGDAAYISGFGGDGFLGAGATVDSGGSWHATRTSAVSSYFSTGAGASSSYIIFGDTGLGIGSTFGPTQRFSVDVAGNTDIYTGRLDMHGQNIQNANDISGTTAHLSGAVTAGANSTFTAPLNVTRETSFDTAYINLQNSTSRALIGIDQTGMAGLTPNQLLITDASGTAQPVNIATAGIVGYTLNTDGSSDLHSHLLHNVTDPIAAQDAATKNYVDTSISAIPASANQSLSNLTNPTSVNQDLIPLKALVSELSSTISGPVHEGYDIPDNGPIGIGEPFTPTSDFSLVQMTLDTYTFSVGTGNVRLAIYTDNAGNPDTFIGTSDDLDTSTLSPFSNQTLTFTYSTPVALTNGTPYWWSLEQSSGFSGTRLGEQASSVSGPGPAHQFFDGTSWSATGSTYFTSWVMSAEEGQTLGVLATPWDDTYTSELSVVSGANSVNFVAPALSGDTTYVLPAADGSSGDALVTDGAGNLSWASGGGGGANTALSNLASTAVNTDILPDSTQSHTLGNAGLYWNQVFSNELLLGDGSGVTQSDLRDTSFAVALAFGTRTLNDTSSIPVVGWNSSGLDMMTHTIVNVVDPTNPQDAATKNYVDSAVGGANTQLSNLGTTAINANLTFGPSVAGDIQTLSPASGVTSQNMTVNTGNVTGAAASGNTTISTGTSGSASSGIISIQSGNAASSSGGITIQSGQVTAGSGATGSVNITTGFQAGSGSSGSATLQSGSSSVQTGTVNVNSGNGTTTNGASGGVNIKTGTSVGTGGTGGITIQPGTPGGTGSIGGVSILGGTYTGTGSVVPGAIAITGGAVTNASATAGGGNINITTPNNSGTGASGNINITTGNSSNAGAAGSIFLTGGNNTGTGGSFTNPGNITINAGNQTGASGSLAFGGFVSLSGGGVTSSTATAQSGSVRIFGGAQGGLGVTTGSGPSATSVLQSVLIQGGNITNVNNANNAGHVLIAGGTTNSTGGGPAGGVYLYGGVPTGTNNPGGVVQLNAGASTGSGSGGTVTIAAGASTSGTGGAVAITGGGSAGSAGSVFMTAGTSTGGTGGFAAINAGDSGAGNGADVSVRAGAAQQAGTGAAGGNVQIQAGNIANSANTGGSVNLTTFGTGSNRGRFNVNAPIQFENTITAIGTNGNQTINKTSGTVNIAAGGNTVTVTNNLVSSVSFVFAVLRTNDTTATIKNVTVTNGAFTINLGANATAAVAIAFFVINS